MEILFICTGNTCRSPMAMVLARHIFAKEGIAAEISSAGISVFAPMPASAHAIAVMAGYGLSLEGHFSRQADESMLAQADLVLAMTSAHASHLKALSPQSVLKVFTLGQYAGEIYDVPDPFAQPLQAYEKCAADLFVYIEKAARRLKTNDFRRG